MRQIVRNRGLGSGVRNYPKSLCARVSSEEPGWARGEVMPQPGQYRRRPAVRGERRAA